MSQLKDLTTQLNTFITGLRTKRGALVSERDTLNAEREGLLSATLDRADTKTLMLAYIDQQANIWNDAARWREVFGELTYPDRYPGSHISRRPNVGLTEPMSLRDFDAILFGTESARGVVIGKGFSLIETKAGSRLCDGALFALFGDHLKAKLSELFDRFYSGPITVDEKRIGPPIAERRQRLEVIGQRLAQIADELMKIDHEARELSADLSEPTPPRAERQKAHLTPPEMNKKGRRYSGADVQKLSGLTYRELIGIPDLRPIPPSEGVGEGWYDVGQVEHWLRANGYQINTSGSWAKP